MNVIVCNIGSTSFKFKLLDMETVTVLARGNVERIGSADARLRFYRGEEDLALDETGPVENQRAAVMKGIDFIENDIVDSPDDIGAVGFKAVQGGDNNWTVLIDDDVIRDMEIYNDLAPAHNPVYIEAMRMFGELMPTTPQVGVFEPGFHAGKPDYAAVYGVPHEWYERYGVRRYGYHGASLRYVTGETVRVLGLPENDHRIVACHLGGSSSVCAFKNGKSIDTSMGFTPQTGLIQSNRSGTIDAFIVPYIMDRTGMPMEEVYQELGSNGGLKGISGVSGDMRDILEAIEKGNDRARLARDKYIYDIVCHLGAYITVMGGVDAVCFTGGTGQHDAGLRKRVLGHLNYLGFRLDDAANDRHEVRIDAPDSAIAALVLETDEELIVARETVRRAGQAKSKG